MSRSSVGPRPKCVVRRGVAIVVLVNAWAATCFGQEPDAATVAAARSLAIDGVKLADSGDCTNAAEKLGKAEELYHSQVVASRLAECEVKLGRLVEGTERLRRLLRETIPDNASPAVQKAFARAQEVLAETTPNLAALNISIVGPEPAQVVVQLNGSPVPAAALGVELPANPGLQIVEVSAPGFYSASERVTLQMGQTASVSVVLKPQPQAAKPPVRAEPITQQASPRVSVGQQPLAASSLEDHPGSSHAPTYASFVVGVVGLGVGAGFGFAAKSDYDMLAPKCPSGLCPIEEQDNLKNARTKGTIATIGIGVGAAGMLLGTIFLLAGGDSDSASATTAQVLGLPPGVRTWMGFGAVGASAEF